MRAPITPSRRLLRIVFAITAAVLSLTSVTTPAAADPLSAAAQAQIDAIMAEKLARTPAQQKMDSQLLYFVRQKTNGVALNAVPTLVINLATDAANRVLVDVRADKITPALRDFITLSGGLIVSDVPAFGALRVRMPVAQIEALATRDEVRFVEPAAEASTNVGTYVSQAVRTHRVDTARTTYGADGTGLKIGVISDGVNSLAASKASGNLNGNATFLAGQAGSGDEGTAMMELIQDMLPGAQLIFATGNGGNAVMANNIQSLATAGCSIIVDDLNYFNESPFQDQVISQAVTTVSNAGVMYFSCARNSGSKDAGTSGTWEGDFVDGGAAVAPVTTAGRLHDFGGAVAFDTVSAGGTNPRVDLFWSDPVGGSTNDYDLFVLNSTGTTVNRMSTNIQSGTQDPYENVGTLVSGERIVIVKKATAAARFLHLDTGRMILNTSTAGCVRGHNCSGAANAFSIAATSVVNSPSPSFFVGGATNPAEAFSSDGPRRMFYQPNGTPYTAGDFSSTGGTVLSKPDLTAADAARTSVGGFYSFSGTSAAAPNAAAIAALLKSYNPSLTPAQIRNLMTTTALDIGTAGFDRTTGAGIAMALQAVQAASAPDSLNIGASGLDGVGPVGGPFTFTTGTYTLTNNGASPLNWTAASTQTWNVVTPASGTLAAGASVVVTAAIKTDTAATLAAGNYLDTVTFTNTTSGFARNFTLSLALSIPSASPRPVAVLPADGGTSGNGRAPIATFNFIRSVYLITAAELVENGITPGVPISGIGWRYTTAPGVTASAPLNIYLQNTSDTTNTKSTTWSTAIAGMTTVHSATTTLPNSTTAFDVTFTGGSAFTYTGGGLYVAFDWGQYTGTLSTTCVVACNFSGLVNGIITGQGSSQPTTLAASNFRPETRLTFPYRNAPMVTSPTSTSITTGGATLGGNLTLDWGQTITARGVVYAKTSDNPAPKVGGSTVTVVNDAANTTGVFSESVLGLAAATGYSFAAFATNALGATYTSPVSTFTTGGAPTITTIAPQTILEDQATTALAFMIGDDVTPAASLTLTALSSNTTLVPVSNVQFGGSGAARTVTVTPVGDQNGSATITVRVADTDGNSTDGTFVVTVTAVNDVPSFTKGADQTVLEDATAQTISGWATALSAGPANESAQGLNFIVSNNNAALFSVAPAVAANGTLTYTPAANANGTATVTVQIHDDGGAANGGLDTSSAQTFTITVTSVNDQPTLALITDPAAILEDAGAQTVNLSGINAGGGETQTLTVTATSNNPGLIPNPTVTYTSPSATGTLSYTPVGNAFGSALITVTVQDNGGTANGGIDTVTRTFTVNVTGINDQPTLAAITDPAVILEDAVAQTVNLSGISAGPGETQVLTVTATSNNTALIPNPTVTYTSPNPTGSLSYTPVANQSGTATITITVQDNGGTANGGVDTITRTFVVNVTPVNDAPTLAFITDPAAILEDATAQTINLSGITAGPSESQTLTVTATSGNPALIPDPSVTYTSPSGTGTLSYTPVANQFGTALITVTVKDNGGTANGGVDTFTRTFSVTVTGVNDQPTLTAIGDPAAIPQGSGAQTVNFAGVSAGPNETQVLTVSASSNNTALLPNPTVTYASPSATGSLSYTPVASAFGTAVVTVTVTDNGGTANGGVNAISRTFTVTVLAEQPPTLDAITDRAAILEESGLQTVGLTGITDGDGTGQALSVTATSDNTALIPNPTVTYTSPSTTGSISYTPVANAFGTATVTVTVHDPNLTFSRSFLVTVTGVNDPPALDLISDPAAILEDAAAQTVNLSGLSAGPNETQTLTVTASSNNTALIPNPTVTYTSPSATGSLSYTPVANQSGTATITVTVQDNGGTANGGVDVFTRTFTVTVTPVNDQPTLAAITNPAAILEDAGAQTVNLSGISAGPSETQTLTVTATSNNPALIPNPTVTYSSPGATGSLAYTPVGDQFGSAIITVKVQDNGGTANGGVDFVTQTFTVTVTPVNDAPTLTTIANPAAILEGAGQQTISLSGITAGVNETQGLVVSATSSNTALIPNPTVTYTSANPTGSLAYTPVADANGTAVITVKVQDDGGTANGGVDSFARTFTVAVTAVNDAPSFTKGADRTVLEDATAQTVPGWATALSAGPVDENTQVLDFIVSNNNAALFSTPPAVAANGTLTFTPAPNANGAATVTVQIHDNGGTANGGADTSVAQTFTITVTPVNDAPTLAQPADLPLLEDAGLQSVSLAGIGTGAANETQTLTITATSSNTSLIPNPAVTYTSPNAAGSLAFTPVADTSGTAIITVTVKDNGGTANGGADTLVRTCTVTVTGVNDAPSFAKGLDQTRLEDAGPQTVSGWASALSAGPANESAQVLDFLVTNNNAALFAVAPAVAANGTLTFTPAADATGSATVTVRLHDNGGTANGGFDTSGPQTFTITLTPVNDPPSFTKGANQSVLEDAGGQTIGSWAAGVSAGPADESAQAVNFIVSNDNAALFAVAPAVAPNGTLTFTPLADVSGSATVTVRLHDNGGVANGGADTSAPQTFTIAVTPVNDAPSFTGGVNLTLDEDAGAQTMPAWATAISAGPADESTQTLDFTIANDKPGLFADLPAISATGTLTFTPAANANGVATLTVRLHDNGGTADGGADTSVAQSFTITINAVNDVPSFTKGTNQTAKQNVGMLTVPGWATSVSAGPPDESGQALNFIVSNDNAAIFTVAPAVAANGTLTYQPAFNASGTATVSVQLHDSGGTTPGVDTSVVQTFLISTTPVNDAPTFTMGPDQSFGQDRGAQTVVGWAKDISPGPSDETAQTVDFLVDTDQPSLFTAVPAITPGGSLTFTPAASASGTATVTVRLHDNGGTANGGVDTTAPKTFRISVTTFTEELGTYNGLVTAPDASTPENDRTGLIKVKVVAKGVFTGSLKLARSTFVLRGTFDKDGVAHFGLLHKTELDIKRLTPLTPLTLSLKLDVGQGTDKLKGLLKDAGVDYAQADADRALYSAAKVPVAPLMPVPPALVGRYTALFPARSPAAANRPASTYPQGDGYGLLTIAKTGSMTMTGRLADGTVVSYANALSKTNAWPVYLRILAGKGSLSGVAQLRDQPGVSDLDGSGFHWFKPAIPLAKLYPAGWLDGIQVDFVGGKVTLVAGQSVLPGLTAVGPAGNAEITFNDAGLAPPGFLKKLNVKPTNLTAAAALAADRLALSLTNTGAFTGRFINPLTLKTSFYRGVILQKQKLGSGYFLTPTESGSLSLEPLP